MKVDLCRLNLMLSLCGHQALEEVDSKPTEDEAKRGTIGIMPTMSLEVAGHLSSTNQDS